MGTALRPLRVSNSRPDSAAPTADSGRLCLNTPSKQNLCGGELPAFAALLHADPPHSRYGRQTQLFGEREQDQKQNIGDKTALHRSLGCPP
jgi:hypothetical protein